MISISKVVQGKTLQNFEILLVNCDSLFQIHYEDARPQNFLTLLFVCFILTHTLKLQQILIHLTVLLYF